MTTTLILLTAASEIAFGLRAYFVIAAIALAIWINRDVLTDFGFLGVRRTGDFWNGDDWFDCNE